MAVTFLGFAVICLVILDWRLINQISRLQDKYAHLESYADRINDRCTYLTDQLWMVKQKILNEEAKG